jgi:acyl dehydratase
MGLNLLVEVLERALGPAFATAETDIRFVRPVLVGQTIQAGARLKDAASGAYEVYVESEDGARAVEGTLVLKPDAGRPAR